MARLVYTFAKLVGEARKEDNELEVPSKIYDEYKDKRLDVRAFKDGHGLAFKQIYNIFKNQTKQLEEIGAIIPFDLKVLEKLHEYEGANNADTLFLEVFDSIQQEHECVYGIVKDEAKKRIIVAFRGSATLRDWITNINAQLIAMKTPSLLRDKLEGSLKDEVNIHRGYYSECYNLVPVLISLSFPHPPN